MRSQEREPHLVQAGGSEIHMDMSEGPYCMVFFKEKMHMDMSEEPFCVEIYRKKGTGTGHRSHFVASGDHVLDGS